MLDSLIEVSRAFRIADAADILFVAVFLYCVLHWLKQTASRLVFVGVSLLAVLYFLAQTFEMYMTTLLFNGTFVVLGVALVLVFQQDLRRGLERMVMLGTWGQRARNSDWAGEVDLLVEVAFTLAEDKIGALLVLQGNAPVEAYVDDGIPLSAGISRPLLFSIFDPHSSGHDGAVIIEHGRVTRFAARLPLSKSLNATGSLGTRHAAAVGMSEATDALVIVVSEERGVVSVAQRGKLRTIDSVSSLKLLIEGFLKSTSPKPMNSTWKKVLMNDARTKLLAVSLAIAGWFALAYHSETVYRTFVVPVEYLNVPKNVEMDDTVPNEARVTFSGSSQAFRFLAPSLLKVTLDLNAAREGRNAFTITEKHVRHPPNLNVYRVEPRVINVPLRE